MDMMLLAFSSKSKDVEARLLSNFAEIGVEIGGKRFKTGEHAFHGMKYCFAAQRCQDADRKEKLERHGLTFADPSSYGTPLDAKRAGGKGKLGVRLEPEELAGWDQFAEKLQRDICLQKWNKCEAIRKLILVDAREKYLLHQDNRAKPSTPWGGRLDKSKDSTNTTKIVTKEHIIGRNKLGEIWMTIRKEEAAKAKRKRKSNDAEETSQKKAKESQ